MRATTSSTSAFFGLLPTTSDNIKKVAHWVSLSSLSSACSVSGSIAIGDCSESVHYVDVQCQRLLALWWNQQDSWYLSVSCRRMVLRLCCQQPIPPWSNDWWCWQVAHLETWLQQQYQCTDAELRNLIILAGVQEGFLKLRINVFTTGWDTNGGRDNTKNLSTNNNNKNKLMWT